jgi:oligopeptide/dipeptide ABC transporter ATP-binding protein
MGDLPSPLDRPAGCVFSTRCPLADDRCRTEEPALRPVGNGRTAACHYAETADVAA